VSLPGGGGGESRLRTRDGVGDKAEAPKTYGIRGEPKAFWGRSRPIGTSRVKSPLTVRKTRGTGKTKEPHNDVDLKIVELRDKPEC